MATPGTTLATLDTPDPAERGTTTVADKVVEKIAARAALDVEHVQGLSRSLAGREVGRRGVRASVDVDGRTACLRLELAVEYPASVLRTTRAAREHVGRQLSRLCDLTVDHIDIQVAVLRRHDTDRRRVQ